MSAVRGGAIARGGTAHADGDTAGGFVDRKKGWGMAK